MLATLVFASDIKWMTLADAKIAAKRDNKIIMVEVSAHGCRYCVDMANTTLKNQAVVDKINRHFAPVLYYSNSDEIPREFSAKGTPTFFFRQKRQKAFSAYIRGMECNRL